MVHRNARLTPAGRRILVQRVFEGRPVAHVAKEMSVSRTCAHRWLKRYVEQGWDGMEDRSSIPTHARTPRLRRKLSRSSWRV
jgi:transposase